MNRTEMLTRAAGRRERWDLIVIGGGIAAAAGEFILPQVLRVVSSTAIASSAKQVEVRLSQLDETGSAIGATLLVAEEALRQFFVAQWDHDGNKSGEPEAYSR